MRSAERLAPAAYWSSWADALPMMWARQPTLTERIIRELEAGPGSALPSLWAASAAAAQLREEGCAFLPAWRALLSPTEEQPRTRRLGEGLAAQAGGPPGPR